MSTHTINRAETTTGRSHAVGFLATFLAAWFALDQLVTSPPTLWSALLCLAVAGGIVALGETIVFGASVQELPRRLGFCRPRAGAIPVATGVGALVFVTYLTGAAALGVDLELRSNWPAVLVSALLFHGLAEEVVWRGFVFAHLRRRTTFWRAMAGSVPLIALTHVTIIVSNGPVIGGLAVVSAAVTCLPLAHLWERSGRTVWAPATLHGAIGTWQLFERTYPDSFSIVLVTGSILVPLLALLWRPED
jgi:membrane protease YdiL (CAAX protease family)